MSTKEGLSIEAFRAKQFREFYALKFSSEGATFRKDEDIVLDLLQRAGEELKLEEIYYRFFSKEGKQYDCDELRQALLKALKKLCEAKKVQHTQTGYYKAI